MHCSAIDDESGFIVFSLFEIHFCCNVLLEEEKDLPTHTDHFRTIFAKKCRQGLRDSELAENESDKRVSRRQTRTSRCRHTQQLHMNEIGLDKQFKYEKIQASESCNRSCSLFNVPHFLFLALMARLSSVGLVSKIPVLTVSINRQEVIVFVRQSDNIADVSIQR